jgi:hypothetical protein
VTGRRWLWIALAVALFALLVWPLQVLAIAMLVTAGFMVISIYAAFVQHGMVPARVRSRLNERMPIAIAGIVVVGAVATMVWPTTLTPIVFGLLVLACVAWLASEWLLGHRHARDAHVR